VREAPPSLWAIRVLRSQAAGTKQEADVKIRVGERGEMRHVRVEGIERTKENTVYVTGLMGFGRAERVAIEIDADTLAEIVRAALQGGLRPELKSQSNPN
jgi:acetylglutamate kinase